MKNNIQNSNGLRPKLSLTVLVLIVGLGITPTYADSLADSLYVGDESNNTVKRFNAAAGKFLGEFVKSGN